jgi:hypothetical protein
MRPKNASRPLALALINDQGMPLRPPHSPMTLPWAHNSSTAGGEGGEGARRAAAVQTAGSGGGGGGRQYWDGAADASYNTLSTLADASNPREG